MGKIAPKSTARRMKALAAIITQHMEAIPPVFDTCQREYEV
jgi:hypothetical protein